MVVIRLPESVETGDDLDDDRTRPMTEDDSDDR